MYKILIIEDEKLICEELSILLSNAGFLVDYIVDFKHTLQQIKIFAPDLILLDINLPGQDGYKLYCSMEEEEWEYLVVGCLTMLVKVKEVKTLTVDSKDSTSIRNSC